MLVRGMWATAAKKRKRLREACSTLLLTPKMLLLGDGGGVSKNNMKAPGGDGDGKNDPTLVGEIDRTQLNNYYGMQHLFHYISSKYQHTQFTSFIFPTAKA